jgi:hypothetical protein
MMFIYVFYVVIIILLFVLIQKIKANNEHFTTSSKPRPTLSELISSYWNKYMHFVNKRSKCIDCDKTSSMDHPYREVQMSRKM